MKENTSPKKQLPQTVSIVALVFLLIGIFAILRTVSNFLLFEKYPNNGVLSFGFNYGQREEDCHYPMTYFDFEGKPRSATTEEQQIADEQKAICLDSVKNSRQMAKINDISVSLFFIFLGAGVLVGKRYL